MTFLEAWKLLLEGKNIRHEDWPLEYYIFFRNNKIKDSEGKYPALLDIDRMISNRWEIVEPTFDFAEAMKRVEKGKTVRRKGWTSTSNFYIVKNSQNQIVCKNGKTPVFCIDDFKATDYQEYQEPRSEAFGFPE